MPPKLTFFTPTKLDPQITTVEPFAATLGKQANIVGGGKKVKPLMEATPYGVVTIALPVAPVPTTAVIFVDETTVNALTGTPPRLTLSAADRLKPVIVIDWPVKE